MNNSEFFSKTKGKLIVSCQALEDEPLHSSQIMARMAYAVMLGGAAGIRANSVADIEAIKNAVDLPVIGIIKKIYSDSEVYITPTETEIDNLVQCGVDVIATDATDRPRPEGGGREVFFRAVRERYPDQLFMADCATLDDGIAAERLGFDVVSTTLCGYTEATRDDPKPNIRLIRDLIRNVRIPVVVEGGIWDKETFDQVRAIEGVHAVVIGSAITRPMEITRYFLQGVSK
ncbi:N-acetylmannosamine-6-phosphate 2-epimerase [Breznakiella homolactica]|uniref:Putative N-acetylmannosamine-6-phosphate 2-epimerase n=1 Tax=Breznakiella homolactica TaxID=2798577 RepID=A0A7T7XNF0_9SPIR|nr:N-acetylmannosamine-6-phosphate 2-epimerase [Breznakiella homolactica]QQO09448.1 N-acetylmannosamine-6-phosphate 2-epimerase [Breznakiella homolactica]